MFVMTKLVACVILAIILHVAADMVPEEQMTDTTGISLMQSSGGAVLPVMSKHVTEFPFDDANVDAFAMMEDEFDDGVVHVPTARRVKNVVAADSRLDHVRNPYLYMETLFVIAVFALAGRAFKWLSRKSTITATEVLDTLPESSAKVSATAMGLGAGPTVPGCTTGFAALEEAVRSGDEARCSEVLRHGGHWVVRQEDPYGCTALHVAAHCGSETMVKLLLKHGAKVDACEAWDETPLHIAARQGNVDVCRVLLAHGANIAAADANGYTPLLSAGHAGQESVCEMLLSQGAGVGGVDETDLPPLVNALLFRRVVTNGPSPKVNAVDDDEHEEVWEDDGDEHEEVFEFRGRL